jgi:hypothetical protein
MVALSKVSMTDLSRQKRFETDLRDELTPRHTVGQAVEMYLDRMGLPDRDSLRWAAFSRGVRLDSKRRLEEVPDTDSQWTVLPEVTAGGH